MIIRSSTEILLLTLSAVYIIRNKLINWRQAQLAQTQVLPA